MFSKFKSVFINAVRGPEPVDSIDSPRPSISTKYEYSRPSFLKFSEEEISAASDVGIRPLILPRDVEFPFNAGYCECINAGKSKLNEDQGAFWRRKLTPKWWSSQAKQTPEETEPIKEDEVTEKPKSWGDGSENVDPSLTYTVFAIFDGHGGPMVAVIAAKEMEQILHGKLEEIADELMPNEFLFDSEVLHQKGGLKYQIDFRKPINPSQLIVGALESSFNEMDKRIGEDKENFEVKGGCTALVVLFILGKVYTACAGDSRAIVAVGDWVEPLSRDHTPNSERVRICRLGYQKSFLLKNDYTSLEFHNRPTFQDVGKSVLYRHPEALGYTYRTIEPGDLKMPLISGTGKRARLMGIIGVTRGFGDHELKALGSTISIKPFLSALPEIRILDITKLTLTDNDIIIMGSDGLFDVTENTQAVNAVRSSFQKMTNKNNSKNMIPSEDMRYMCAAQDLVNYARGKPSMENRSWKKNDGNPASGDDITSWVIPILPYFKEHEQWSLKSATNVPTSVKCWSGNEKLPICCAEDCLLSDTQKPSSMEPFQNCTDTSDITEISLPQQLFLKPEAKLNVTVALPQVRLPGKTISNWEVMERLKQMIRPDEFMALKVSKSTLEFIRFDAEIENRAQLSNVITRLEGKSIKLSGFPELLKIKAAESKPDFPTRHDWDKYFRDAKNMNEMKPGERPDTIHIENLPSKWFISKKDKRNGIETPNEFTLQKVFEIFGEIRYVDIPMLDPYRNQMKASISGIKKFSHSTDSTFDAYIQYKEYICFVKAMNALRGMKLVHRDGNKAYSASIKVDFDKTKHLSDMSIRRRKLEREKLMAKEREKEEEKRREEEAIRIAMEEENRKKMEEKELKGKRQKEREEKRKQKILKKLKKKEAEQMNIKIAIEERKLLMAQRKLESIRLLDELFERVKQEKQRQEDREKESEADEKSKKKKNDHYKKKRVKDRKKKEKIDKEKELRKKLVKKIKTAQEQQMEERRERLLKTIEGKNKLKSGLHAKDGGEDEEFEMYRPADFNYDAFSEYSGHESYRRAYGFPDWGLRGFRGFVPRRSYRSHRGGFSHYHDWAPYPEHLDDRKTYEPEERRKPEKTVGDGMEDISSDSSSGSSSYSDLDSENGDKKSKDGKSTGHFSAEWSLYEGPSKGDVDLGGTTHPWVGYSDYYNPRFFRSRGLRRPRGGFIPRRGWGRGFPVQPNPNVPMSSFYMQSINSQYYKYFNKLAKGDYEHEYRSRSRSRSHSSERVVCRKVLSRSRSRSRKYSQSESKSRSRSRSSSRSRRRSRSRSGSRSIESHRRRSRSRSHSHRRRSESRQKRSKSAHRSRSKTKSRSKSREKKKEEFTEGKSQAEVQGLSKDETEQKAESEGTDQKEKSAVKEKKIKDKDKDKDKDKNKEKEKRKEKEKNSEEKKIESSSKAKSEESDWSLSLSGSDGWSRGSPERKARPLGDPNWVPDRRDRDSERTYRTLMSKVSGTFRNESYMGYDRLRDRYKHSGYRVPEEREPNLRSHISRPKETSDMYHSDTSAKDSKKSRHKRDKKRKRKYHDKRSSSKKRKTSRSDSD